MDWQPIETAPKDGTPFLAWYDKTAYGVPLSWAILRWCAEYNDGGVFKDGAWATFRGEDYGWDAHIPCFPPTHWKPLPAPPSGSKEK